MGIFRELFGPSKEEIWRQLCAEIDARYVKGDLLHGDKVEATVGEWTVTLDTYTVHTGKTSQTYTRLRAPFVNTDGFRFTIYRKSIFSGIGKFLGMQDIEIGDRFFDEDFIIQSSNRIKVQTLLTNPRLKELIQAQPAIRFEVADDAGFFGKKFPQGVDMLSFSALGVMKDVEKLKGVFELFSETLNSLCGMGSAYRQEPDVKL
jgi:hypothetical protein